MIDVNGEQTFYVYNQAVDMRKSIDGLSYLVCEVLEGTPQSGGVYLFHNKALDKVKLLYWDKNGFVLHYKRLEKGKFKLKRKADSPDEFSISKQQLTWLLAGLDFNLMDEFKDLDYSNYY